jgi:Protein of unknown function (DUF1194)
MKRLCRRLLLCACFVPGAERAIAQVQADLALVLAVDCSGSVDRAEFRLQLDGIAAAFRDEDVLAAIRSGPHGNITVNMMLWADPDEQKLTTGWFTISNESEAETFARTAEAFDTLIGGGTGLGVAMAYGVTLLNHPEVHATRKTIDVSGDGKESWELREPRFRALHAQALLRKTDITVNGLAISTDYPDLAAYYRNTVIVGPGSFVIEAKSYGDFADAMKVKLLREILPDVASLN